jgi:hypothetical protein
MLVVSLQLTAVSLKIATTSSPVSHPTLVQRSHHIRAMIAKVIIMT